MIIIIDEASAKLASFYYHGEIFKLQWRSVAGKASMSEELQEKLYGALPGKLLDELQKKLLDELQDEFQEKLQEKLPDELREKLYVALLAAESINDFTKTTIQEYADNTAKANTGNLIIPKAPADCFLVFKLCLVVVKRFHKVCHTGLVIELIERRKV